MPFGVEKLERRGYPAVEKISKISIRLFVLTESTNVSHTHRHRMTAYAALMHSIARQNVRDDKTVRR